MKQYLDALTHVLEHGETVSDRTGVCLVMTSVSEDEGSFAESRVDLCVMCTPNPYGRQEFRRRL